MNTNDISGRRVHSGPFHLAPLFAPEMRVKTGCESGFPIDVRDHAVITPEESAALSRLLSVPGYSMVTSSSSGMRPRSPTELYDDEDAPV